MKIKKIILLFIAIFATAFIYAQNTADAIINAYIQAVGGADKISKINSVNIQSSMQIMGSDAQNTVTILNGKGFKSVVNINGQQVVQCVTDKGGWMINPFMGISDPTAMSADMYKAAKERLFVNGLLFNYKKTGHTVRLAGTDTSGGATSYMIEVTSSDNVKSVYYIDSLTHFINKLIFDEGGPLQTTVVYSNYKKTDFGNTVPFTQELTPPQQNMSFTVNINKIEVNNPVDFSFFDMPKK